MVSVVVQEWNVVVWCEQQHSDRKNKIKHNNNNNNNKAVCMCVQLHTELLDYIFSTLFNTAPTTLVYVS